jgi:hypothetical protein
MFDVPYCCGLFGHSHAARLLGAYHALISREGEANVKPQFKFGLLRSLEEMSDDDSETSPQRQAALDATVADVLAAPRPDVIVTILKGSATAAFSLPRHPRPFDFVQPGMAAAGLVPEAEVIPYGLVKRLLAHDMANGSDDFLAALARQAPQTPVYVVPPPPPVASEDFLSRQKSAVCQQIAKRGANPRSVRRKFWLAYLEVLKAYADQHGARIIDLPQEAYDGDGFFAECYWDDATHGNAAYSMLMLETIDRTLRERRDP